MLTFAEEKYAPKEREDEASFCQWYDLRRFTQRECIEIRYLHCGK